jgi:hypothetical protein
VAHFSLEIVRSPAHLTAQKSYQGCGRDYIGPEDALPGQVADVRDAGEEQHVMLAEGAELRAGGPGVCSALSKVGQ